MTAMTSISAQWLGGAMEKANESSDVSPARSGHSTKPAGTLREAEPEPSRAMTDSSFSESESPAAVAPATVSAAKAEADEASPAPAGKLFWDWTRALSVIPALERI